MRHLFVTQDYAPDLGGMARRHLELCRRFADGDESTMSVSTVAAPTAKSFDDSEPYAIYRQPFPFKRANRFVNEMRWGAWLTTGQGARFDVLHCGNIRPVGYPVYLAHRARNKPYLVYVNGGDLLREKNKAGDKIKRAGARAILGGASGIVATSDWVAKLSNEVLDLVGVEGPPPVAALGLGTDPVQFHPSRDTGALRRRWDVGDARILLTVARLVPHKGQDNVIRALAVLKHQFRDLRYVLVGEGHDEQRLRDIARELNVEDRVGFVGPMRDDELPEAYATSTLYAGMSRIDREINAEGYGISFLEAGASGIPSVAGDSGGVRSAVRDGETGVIVPPESVDAIVSAIRTMLVEEDRRKAMGVAARRAVETYYNWDRVARDTREFTYRVTAQQLMQTT
ncbi:MAG: glycosyltransferase family 4 protein [Gemmatimonadaceae bacterium]|nr:glycosyltransferase family 4 protein [Gemmatimonadaceae bacterium]